MDQRPPPQLQDLSSAVQDSITKAVASDGDGRGGGMARTTCFRYPDQRSQPGNGVRDCLRNEARVSADQMNHF